MIIAAVAFTAGVALLPWVRFTYVSASTRVAMDTAQGLIAGAVAFLLHGRYRRSQSAADLAMTIALGLSALTNVVTVVIRAATEDAAVLTPFAIWSAQALTVMASAAFVVAAWSRPRPVSERRRRLIVAGASVAAFALTLVVAATADSIPLTLTDPRDPRSSSSPVIDADASILWIHGLVLMLRFVGAAGFWRRAIVSADDPVLTATAIGLTVAGIARFNFILYPSLYTHVVHSGDVLRLGFYLILLVGASREVRGYWQDREALAVLGERQRIARDLHDGLTQELSFIRSQTDALRRGRSDPAMLDFVAQASERALRESRRTIETLRDPEGPLVDRIRQEVVTVADRSGLGVGFSLAPCRLDDARTVDQVTRIAREATVNVVKHAGATTIDIALSSDHSGLRLSITDDGVGFDPDTVDRGFGIESMTERARALGGELSIERAIPRGTRVVLSVPGPASPHHFVEEGDDAGDVP